MVVSICEVYSQSDQKWQFFAKKCYTFWLVSRQFAKVLGYFSLNCWRVGYSSVKLLIMAFFETFWQLLGMLSGSSVYSVSPVNKWLDKWLERVMINDFYAKGENWWVELSFLASSERFKAIDLLILELPEIASIRWITQENWNNRGASKLVIRVRLTFMNSYCTWVQILLAFLS